MRPSPLGTRFVRGQRLDCWFGQAQEYWDEDVRPRVLHGGVRSDPEDRWLEPLARAGVLAPAQWVVMADLDARIRPHDRTEITPRSQPIQPVANLIAPVKR